MAESDMTRIEVGLAVATDPPVELRTVVGIHRARWGEMDWEQQTAWLDSAKDAFVASHVTSWATPLDDEGD
jgi:hypothetical protein